MFSLNTFPDLESLALNAAEYIINIGSSAIQRRGRFLFVLAGGSTPLAVYSLLASPHHSKPLDWSRVHFFWGDERCVPPDHPDSNYRTAKSSLLDFINPADENVHRIPAELAPDRSVRQYQDQIRSLFPDQEDYLDGFPSFDLILLGMGDDGHTASLFPGSPALQERFSWVASVRHNKPPAPLVDRITLTLPVFNAAANILFMVSGSEKAQPLEQVLSNKLGSKSVLPAAMVQPRSGNLTWFVDHAASKLYDRGDSSGFNAVSTSIIIPTLNEAESLGGVLAGIGNAANQEVIVVDGGSSDRTVEIARESGAHLILEPRKGYGLACEAGVKHAAGDVLVFMDADGANNPAQLGALVEPVLSKRADIVLGSRLAGTVVPGAMPWHQRLGNWFSARLIQLLYGFPITDLSPFRAVRRARLLELQLEDKTYGWPTEVLIKAIRLGWKIEEIPVDYLPRSGGKSKISGTLRGTFLAAVHIMSVILSNRIGSPQ